MINLTLVVVNFVNNLVGLADLFIWQDIRQFFNNDTSHLRGIVVIELLTQHSSISKWQQ